jgi:hypothetical protein
VGFTGIAEYAGAEAAGRTHFCSFRKVPSQASTAGWWVDLSMASGNPVPNYYAAAPLEAKVLDGFDGIWHGDNKSPASKHLTAFGLMTPTAALVGQYVLCDYVLYYPFVDGDSSDAQAFDNTVTLPRYTTGDGLQVMAVLVAPSTGSGQFTFEYVNQDGNTSTSPTQFCATTAANIATIATSQQALSSTSQPAGPFLTLAAGDRGVRSITSVTFTVPNGGLVALVLVKPLASFAIREVSTMNEVQLVRLRPGCPQIEDGAYLNLLCNPAGSVAAGILAGYATFAWSDD